MTGMVGEARRRIGLYGGTFNPVHYGHLRTAVELCEVGGLTEVWLVPVHVPPHKEQADLAPASSRLRMVERAIAGAPALRASDVEIARPGPSFTIDTVRLLKERHPDVDFSLLLGFDAFREIHTWKNYEALFAECDLLVTSRPPYEVRSGDDVAHFSKLPIAVTRAFWYDEHLRCYAHDSGHRLQFVPVTALDISASRIRDLVASGRSLAYLTPPAVIDFIESERLYRSPSDSSPSDA